MSAIDKSPIQEAFDELMAQCESLRLPFMLDLFDGEHETVVVGIHGSGQVTLLDAAPKEGGVDLSGRVVIRFDAKMMLRLLPRLVRETHRALALVPADADDEVSP